MMAASPLIYWIVPTTALFAAIWSLYRARILPLHRVGQLAALVALSVAVAAGLVYIPELIGG